MVDVDYLEAAVAEGLELIRTYEEFSDTTERTHTHVHTTRVDDAPIPPQS